MKTSGKKRKRPSMRGKDYLYEICAYFFSDLLYFIMTILTLTPPSQIFGISQIRGKEFRNYYPSGLY